MRGLSLKRIQSLHLLLLCLLLGLCIVPLVDAGPGKVLTSKIHGKFINDGYDNDDDDETDLPDVHWLVEYIGKEIFKVVKRPKYKFYIFMTIGTLPEEQSTIALLNTLCNVLYGTLVWLGFMWFPRTFMLLVTLVTLTIGPALVLILLGTIGLALAACALYPVTTVACLWVFFFCTSHFAQAIGRNMGLDGNRDGEVDFLDFLHQLSESRWGGALGLRTLYNVLKDANRNQLQEIHRKLDQIHDMTRDISIRGIVPTPPPPMTEAAAAAARVREGRSDGIGEEESMPLNGSKRDASSI
jgi:hypothetical protein